MRPVAGTEAEQLAEDGHESNRTAAMANVAITMGGFATFITAAPAASVLVTAQWAGSSQRHRHR